jgi:hypothetical protein
VSAETAPLLARVHADLIAMDRDELIDLSEWPALREFVEVTRYSSAWLALHPSGEPWEPEDLDRLEVFLDDDHVLLERLPDPDDEEAGEPVWRLGATEGVWLAGDGIEMDCTSLPDPDEAVQIGLALIAAARSFEGRI